MEIERRMRADITTYGRQLEKLIGDHMFPYERGLYVPTNASPVIRAGVTYRVANQHGEDTVYHGDTLIDNPKLIVGNVFSDKDELVLPVRAVRLLAATPYLPHRSFLMISTIVERILYNHFVYTKVKKEGYMDIVEAQLVKGLSNELINNIYGEVIRILQPLIHNVEEFMADDNFHVHFQTLQGTDLMIEKSVDYRIHVFNEKVANGEWDV